MEKSQIRTAVIFTAFITIMFLITIALYYVSLATGYHGLAIPILGGSDDGVFYLENALEIKNGGNAILTSVHVLVLGYVLKLFNTEYVFYLKMFNFLGVILFAIVSYLLIRTLVGNRHAMNLYSLFLGMMLLFISFVYVSTISIIRDIWIFDFFLLTVWLFAIFLKSNSIAKVLLIIPILLSMFLLFSYRDYAAASFLGAAGLFIFFNRKNKSTNTGLVVITVLVLLGIYYTVLKDFEIPFVGLSLADALNYRKNGQELYAGASQLNISLDQPNYIFFLFSYVYSLISNALGPLPFQVRGFSTLVLFLTESIPMTIIFFYIYKNRKSLEYIDKMLLTQSLIWFLFIGITNDNLGTGSRLRISGYLFILLVFAKIFYMKNWGKKIDEKHEIWKNKSQFVNRR
ncbi:hypothetical protein BHU61_02295 [Macrococcus epidermidis]|uniref:Glycosyltransferase RgtA/B/C/D-like domain-containing protein n=1 Tax=Macrococcus epidermidis TaxID=1902580 RepID=A0A327ZVP8_9STAP|nr:hypothetical protein [Macrococcus epidermidis]MCG7420231.1 hypothetical protein [Macrococcus epidermidis]RAK46299.1 hypothetical protein BHU61_02295 [Macrococcus epidermidis]